MSGVVASARPAGPADAGPDAGAEVFELSLDNGWMDVSILSYGATVVAVRTPDRDGLRRDVALRHPDAAAGTRNRLYLGSTLGRFARIVPHGLLDLDGRRYQLTPNAGPHHIHGGPEGFDVRVWRGRVTGGADRGEVVLSLTSPDGDQGYPGRLECTATFELDRWNRLTARFEAHTDRATLCGLSTHVFWNLAACTGTIAGQTLQLASGRVLEADEDFVPTGRILGVGPDADFREPRALGHAPVDLFFPLPGSTGVREVARLADPISGRQLRITTDQPGLAVYTGDHLPWPRAGICLQPGPWPHAPQHPGFRPAVLRRREVYRSVTTFEFAVGAPAASVPRAGSVRTGPPA